MPSSDGIGSGRCELEEGFTSAKRRFTWCWPAGSGGSAGEGRLPLRGGFVKFLSSLVSIGSGGSIGREGAIVQLAATLASKWGQFAKWQPYRLRLLVGGGAAAGVAARH